MQGQAARSAARPGASSLPPRAPWFLTTDGCLGDPLGQLGESELVRWRSGPKHQKTTEKPKDLIDGGTEAWRTSKLSHVLLLCLIVRFCERAKHLDPKQFASHASLWNNHFRHFLPSTSTALFSPEYLRASKGFAGPFVQTEDDSLDQPAVAVSRVPASFCAMAVAPLAVTISSPDASQYLLGCHGRGLEGPVWEDQLEEVEEVETNIGSCLSQNVFFFQNVSVHIPSTIEPAIGTKVDWGPPTFKRPQA